MDYYRCSLLGRVTCHCWCSMSNCGSTCPNMAWTHSTRIALWFCCPTYTSEKKNVNKDQNPAPRHCSSVSRDTHPSLLNDKSSDCKGGGYGTSSMSPSSLPWLFLSLDSSAPFPGSRHVSDCKFGLDAPSGCLRLDIFLLLKLKR